MKRKLLAAIMLIVLAFGVMAFAACEEKQNDNADVLTVETVPGGCLRTDIRLAMEAIRVPRPPMFVPIISAFSLLVKPERSIAHGTLLII